MVSIATTKVRNKRLITAQTSGIVETTTRAAIQTCFTRYTWSTRVAMAVVGGHIQVDRFCSAFASDETLPSLKSTCQLLFSPPLDLFVRCLKGNISDKYCDEMSLSSNVVGSKLRDLCRPLQMYKRSHAWDGCFRFASSPPISTAYLKMHS